MTGIRETLLSVAEKEIGVEEEPHGSNNTKYNTWFGLPRTPWCGQFVSWVYNSSGKPLGNIGYTKGFAGCETAVAHFKKTGETTKDPQPGDIVFFDWQGDKKSDHTGIFVCWIDKSKGIFETIEGNTSLTNQSNGGQVMRRQRYLNRVHCFVSPKILQQ